MNLFDKFMEVLDSLEREKVEYVLVGGFAVILYGLPRLTQDIDLFIKPDTENLARLKNALFSVFGDASINEIDLEMLDKYPVVRYGSPEGFYIDLIVRLGNAFSFSDIKYVVRDIEGHYARVATIELLYEMKRDTLRPVGKSDSEFLRELLKKSNDPDGGV
jgi:hypothetical protein